MGEIQEKIFGSGSLPALLSLCNRDRTLYVLYIALLSLPTFIVLSAAHCGTVCAHFEIWFACVQKKLPLTALSQTMQESGGQLGDESLIG